MGRGQKGHGYGPQRINGKLTLWGMYYQQKAGAKVRGIDFLLSFEQWLAIWQGSGHLHERGHFKGQYVMSRPGDKGSYTVGNVKIVVVRDNQREANLGKPRPKDAEYRRKISEGSKGKKLTEAHKRAIGDGVRGKTKGVPRNITNARRREVSEWSTKRWELWRQEHGKTMQTRYGTQYTRDPTRQS